MSFQTATYLRKATSRAKSDVANKMVSMFLHDLSRKVNSSLGANVTDIRYADAVTAAFGNSCCYCSRSLEHDRAAVEHLDGMNRFRVGLHIQGNVIVACKRCNGEKRRDDQPRELSLAESGWESFLSHDSTRCPAQCKTCAYWKELLRDDVHRFESLRAARNRIQDFRNSYPEAIGWSRRTKPALQQTLDTIYRECQEFATIRIRKTVDEVFEALSKSVPVQNVGL